jgi:zinc-ribbon domain
MSEPEIARRCSACGVSLRQQAVFCPQCGNPISSQTATLSSVSDTIVDSAPGESLSPDPTATQPLNAIVPPATPAPHRSRRKVPEAGVRGRVEKLRRASSIVIDQAAYDPSLRFLLVAAGLFLLFLLLLILSKVIG